MDKPKGRFETRQMVPDEWQTLKNMRLKALEMHPGFFAGELEVSKQYTEEHWRKNLDGNGKAIFGLFDRGTLVGITAIFTCADDPTGRTGQLAYNFIEPAFRGIGLSQMFYKTRIKWALEHTNWTTIRTGHRIDNTTSQAAILRNGFELIGKNMMTWPDGTDKVELLYSLDLQRMRQSAGQVA